MTFDIDVQKIIDAIAAEVLVVDACATVKFVNRTMQHNDWCRHIVGRSFFEYLEDGPSVSLKDDIAQYLKCDAKDCEADKHFPAQVICSDQTLRPYSLVINPLTQLGHMDSPCFLVSFLKPAIENNSTSAGFCSHIKYLEMIFANTNDAIFLAPLSKDGVHGNFVEVNAAACRRLGYVKDELLNLNAPGINPNANQARTRAYGNMLQKEGFAIFETIHVTKNGEYIPVEVHATIIRDKDSDYVLSVVKDLRAIKKSENSQALLGRLMDYSWNEIYIIDSENLAIRMANEGALKNLGIKKTELQNYTFSDLLIDTTTEQFREFSRELFEGETSQLIYESCLRRINGTSYPVEVRLQLSQSEIPPLLFANVQDITERKKIERRLTYLASYDSVTGLPNKSLYMDRLYVAMEAVKRQDKLIAVMFLDLDGFKQVNDTYGHETGDLLIREVAKRLVKSTRKSDTVARFGGDEFTIILNNISKTEGVDVVLQKIMNNISEPFLLHGKEIVTSPSIGVSLYPLDDRDDAKELLRKADVAMYQAKKKGKRNWVYYSSALSFSESRKNELEAAVRRSLKRKELELFFQPRVDLRDNSIVGAEVLLRWQKSRLGFVSPVEFIPLMERTGLIVEVGEWVLREACLQLRKWMDQGHDFRISVNVSAKQFDGGLLHELVAKILAETNVPSNRLEIEITEGLLIDQSDSAIASLEKMSKTGISISLDDFGTGYSSLSYLKQFPIDILKIDRSFVMDLQDNKDSLVIVEAIIGLAKSLGLAVTAEGIEDKWHADFLLARGCDEGQGYYFAKPMSMEDMQKTLDASKEQALPVNWAFEDELMKLRG